jgi:dTDP-glucose pyrophosphorylase
MEYWKKTLIPLNSTFKKAIYTIDNSGLQIGLVVDDKGILKGTITDGDIRRAVIKGISLDESVTSIMNKSPETAHIDDSRSDIISLMKRLVLRQIPIVDEDGKVLDLEVLMELLNPQPKDNLVVLMAGGLGKRLRPLTDDCPKPLLKIGNKPILETILENFIEYGFRRFAITVNYKAKKIIDYFGNGERWGVSIDFINEKKALGTAGALSLLNEIPTKPIIVMNGDLLTKVNFDNLIDFHNASKAQGTMCVREYDFQVPYGVVELDDNIIRRIEEKPVHRFFVNAGIYILEPESLKLIPRNTYFDMPVLFKELLAKNYKTSAFPITEYWLDIGQINDFHKANGEYEKEFA